MSNCLEDCKKCSCSAKYFLFCFLVAPVHRRAAQKKLSPSCFTSNDTKAAFRSHRASQWRLADVIKFQEWPIGRCFHVPWQVCRLPCWNATMPLRFVVPLPRGFSNTEHFAPLRFLSPPLKRGRTRSVCQAALCQPGQSRCKNRHEQKKGLFSC